MRWGGAMLTNLSSIDGDGVWEETLLNMIQFPTEWRRSRAAMEARAVSTSN
jgi:hypothetical protein